MGRERSEREIHEHHRWQQATTALQISIAHGGDRPAHASSRRLQYGVYGVAGIGVVLGVLACDAASERPNALRGRRRRYPTYSSSPSSWILRVIVLRPMPSFCAASMRRPRVISSAV